MREDYSSTTVEGAALAASDHAYYPDLPSPMDLLSDEELAELEAEEDDDALD